ELGTVDPEQHLVARVDDPVRAGHPPQRDRVRTRQLVDRTDRPPRELGHLAGEQIVHRFLLGAWALAALRVCLSRHEVSRAEMRRKRAYAALECSGLPRPSSAPIPEFAIPSQPIIEWFVLPAYAHRLALAPLQRK